jgi:hypothetical protein
LDELFDQRNLLISIPYFEYPWGYISSPGRFTAGCIFHEFQRTDANPLSLYHIGIAVEDSMTVFNANTSFSQT